MDDDKDVDTASTHKQHQTKYFTFSHLLSIHVGEKEKHGVALIAGVRRRWTPIFNLMSNDIEMVVSCLVVLSCSLIATRILFTRTHVGLAL